MSRKYQAKYLLEIFKGQSQKITGKNLWVNWKILYKNYTKIVICILMLQ